jgi:hypothetical protein
VIEALVDTGAFDQLPEIDQPAELSISRMAGEPINVGSDVSGLTVGDGSVWLLSPSGLIRLTPPAAAI